MAKETGIPEDLAIGQARAESDFDPNAVGDEGKARGILQVQPIARREVEAFTGRKFDPESPKDNAEVGQIFLKIQHDHFSQLGYEDEDLKDFSGAAFNAGPTRVAKDIARAKRKFKTDRPTFEQVSEFLPPGTLENVGRSRLGRKEDQVRTVREGKRTKFSPLTDQIVGKTAEGRNIFLNEDGSRSSERSSTMELDGKHFNFPTMFNGKELSPNKAFDIIIENDFTDPETGRKIVGFDTPEEAEEAARNRSDNIRSVPNVIAKLDKRIELGILTKQLEEGGQQSSTAQKLQTGADFVDRVVERGRKRKGEEPEPPPTEFVSPESGLPPNLPKDAKPSMKQFADDIKGTAASIEVAIVDFSRFITEGAGGALNGLIEYSKTGNADDFVKGFEASQGTLPFPSSDRANRIREFLRGDIIEPTKEFIDDLTEEAFANIGGPEANPEEAAIFNVLIKSLFILAPAKNVGKFGGPAKPGTGLDPVRKPDTGESFSTQGTKIDNILDLAERATTPGEAETALRVARGEMEKGGFSRTEGAKLNKRIDELSTKSPEVTPEPKVITKKDFPDLVKEPVPEPPVVEPKAPIPLPKSTVPLRPEQAGVPTPKPGFAPEPAPSPAPVVKTAPIKGAVGQKATVIAGEQKPGVTYRIVEADDLVPSHDPQTFQPVEGYPEGLQERQYHKDKQAQLRVIDQANKFDPARVLTDDPTGIGGPPIITGTGLVIGGNSRTMTIKRLSPENITAYINELKLRAPNFQFDPRIVGEFKRPVLVRQLDTTPASLEELRALGSDLNQSETAGLSQAEKAVSVGKRISKGTIDRVSKKIEALGEGATLRKLFEKDPFDIVKQLLKDKAITKQDLPTLTDQKRQLLTDRGKALIEDAFLGTVIDQPTIITNLPASIKNKIIGALPSLIRLKSQGGEFDITSDLLAAAEAGIEAFGKGLTSKQFLGQGDLFGAKKLTPRAEEIFKSLKDEGTLKFSKRLSRFAEAAAKETEGQAGFLKPRSPEEIFEETFGGKKRTDETLAARGFRVKGGVKLATLKLERQAILSTSRSTKQNVSTQILRKKGELFHIDGKAVRLKGIGIPKVGDIITTIEGKAKWEVLEVKPIEPVTETLASKSAKGVGKPDKPKKPRVKKTFESREEKPLKAEDQEAPEGQIDFKPKQIGANEIGRLVYKTPVPKDPNLQPKLRQILTRINDKLKMGKSRPDVINRTISELFRVPINEGGIRAKKEVGGLFFIRPQTIRVRNRNNLGVVTHELGHFFSETNKPVRKLFKKHIKEIMEMSPLVYREAGLAIRAEEGFAEFFRIFLTNRPLAQQEMPGFFADFSEFLVNNTAFNELMNEVSMMISDWQGLNPIERFEAKTGRPPWWTELNTLTTKAVLNYMTLKNISKKDPLIRMVEDVDPNVRASLNPAIQYQLNYGSSGGVETWLETGRFPWQVSERLDPSNWGKSLKEILAPVLDQPRFSNLTTIKEFSAFLAALRADELTAKGKENLFTREEINAMLDTVKKFPAEKKRVFEKAAKEIFEYNDDLLQYAQDSGLLDAKTAEIFRLYSFYVPFFRVPDSMFRKATKAITGDSFKQLRGGTQNINDVIENIVKNTSTIIEAAGRNATVLKALRMAQRNPGAGKWLEKWPMPMQALKVNTEQILRALKKEGLDVDPEIAENMSAIQTIFAPKPFDVPDKGIMIIKDEVGKNIAVKINDPGLFEALQDVHHRHIFFVDEILNPIARTLRMSIVLSPEFWARNFTRDTETVAVQSKTKKTFIPIFSSLAGARELLTNSELAKVSKAVGAQGSSVFDSQTTKGIESSRKRLGRISGFDPQSIIFPWELVPRIFDRLERIGAGFENATRMREFKVTYEEALKAGKAPEDAAIEAAVAFREVVDFGDIGTGLFVQATARSAPFFGARIQGWTKFKRTVIGRREQKFGRDQRRAWLRAFFGLTLPALLITAINRMNDTNQDEPDHVKNTYMTFTIDGETYRYPKPWEYGAAFQTVPQRALDWTFDSIENKSDRTEFLTGITSTLLDAVGGYPVPTGFLVPIELWTNKNIFLDRQIESTSQLRRKPGFRYFDHTSEFLKRVGENTGVSPLKMEHAARGFFSNVAMLTLAGMDAAIEAVEGDKGITKPEQTFRQLPIFRVFAPDKERKQSKALNEFYQSMQRVMQNTSTYRFLEKTEEDKAERFLEKNVGADEKDTAKGVRKAGRDISKIRKEISNIRREPDSDFPPNMSKKDIAKDKRQRIIELKAEMVEIAKESNQNVFEAEKEAKEDR